MLSGPNLLLELHEELRKRLEAAYKKMKPPTHKYRAPKGGKPFDVGMTNYDLKIASNILLSLRRSYDRSAGGACPPFSDRGHTPYDDYRAIDLRQHGPRDDQQPNKLIAIADIHT